MRAKWVRFPCTSATRIKQNPGLYPRGFLFGQTLFYYKYLPIFCRTTFYWYGKFWVIFQWDDANVHQYKEGGSSYGSIFGVKNGLLISQNGYFWEMILDVSEL
jgi:hypothetical protein